MMLVVYGIVHVTDHGTRLHFLIKIDAANYLAIIERLKQILKGAGKKVHLFTFE